MDQSRRKGKKDPYLRGPSKTTPQWRMGKYDLKTFKKKNQKKDCQKAKKQKFSHSIWYHESH